MSQATKIIFGGVEIDLPSDLPFSHSTDGNLCLDFSAGFHGKLLLRQSTEAQKRLKGWLPARTLDSHVLSPSRLDLVQDGQEVVIPDSQPMSSMPAAPWFFKPSTVQEVVKGDEDAVIPDSSVAQVDGNALRSSNPDMLSTGLRSSGIGKASANADGVSPETVCPDKGLNAPQGDAPDVDAVLTTAGLNDQLVAFKDTTPDSRSKLGKENVPSGKARKFGKRKAEASRHPSAGKRSGSHKSRASLGDSAEMSFRWQAVQAEGEAAYPGMRWGATMTAVGQSKACLYGGDSHEGALSDTWTLDLSSQPLWHRTKVSGDRPKAWHSSTFASTSEGQHLYTIGGERSRETVDANEEDVDCLSDVCQLDLDASLWIDIPMSGERLHRAGHSATYLPDGRILMFGGCDDSGRHHNSSHIIDLRRLNCFSLTGGVIRGAPPKARAYHSATLVGNSIIVLGGIGAHIWSMKEVYSLSIETMQWREHTASVDGDVPRPRSGHSAVALPGDRFLLIYGGGRPEESIFFGDLAVLDTHTWFWSTPQIQSADRPRARSGHSMSLVERPDGSHVLALFGGRAHSDELCCDTWLLDISLSGT